MAAADPEASAEVPEDVVAQAKASFGPRTPGELAELTFDSLVDEGAPAAHHVLHFEHDQLRIELRVSACTSESSLTGTVKPVAHRRVELDRDPSDPSLVEDVVDGAFSFRHIGHGLVRLQLVGSDGVPAVHTDWFRV